MTPDIQWSEITLRLAVTLIAGTLIGYERGERGRAAGMRTTILVCVAAAASMILANLMISTHGRSASSFVQLDLMRLPLGILSGMGFIGAGAIIRRGNLVTGITTAASLWFVTMMGLCLGAGYLTLGLALLFIGILVLKVFKWVEDRLPQEQRGLLLMTVSSEGPTEDQLRDQLRTGELEIVLCSTCRHPETGERKYRLELCWRAPANRDDRTPEIIEHLGDQPGVKRIIWRPEAF